MTGKIFTESSNIYQDQAKILFSYYRQAAEKIVQEEERIEHEIAVLEEQKTIKNKALSSAVYWLFLFFLLIPIFVYIAKRSSLKKEITGLDIRIKEFKKQHDEIFRDYKVSKLGVAYIPVADQIRYEDKSFIVDYTGKVDESEVTLQLSRQNDLLIDTIMDLESLSAKAPIVETSNETEKIDTDEYSSSIQQLTQHDYFGKLERSLRTISYCMNDLDITSVSLPLVADKSDYLQFLNEYATKEEPQDKPVIEVFDKEKYANSIKKFQELNRLKDTLSNKTSQFEDVLKNLMATMAGSVQAISALKIASTDKVVLESNKIFFQILKAPYNHYSPLLEHEEIERIRNEKFDYSESVQHYEPFQLKPSSKVRYNLISGLWTAEDGSVTNYPFGVHQIYEEIVAPIVQNLMQENRIERLKIYNHIKDQKINYLNQWHQEVGDYYRDNRALATDIINLMQKSLQEYVAAYNYLISLQKTEDAMVLSSGSLDAAVVEVADNTDETLAAFKLQEQDFQNVKNDFESYMDRLKEDIDLKADRFGHVEYYDAKLRDGDANEAAVAASEIHELDERRKPLAAANPLFAKASELQPEPQVEPVTFEHISLNLPVIAKNALKRLESELIREDEVSSSEDFYPQDDYASDYAGNEVYDQPEEPIPEYAENELYDQPEEPVLEYTEYEPYLYDKEELDYLPNETIQQICLEMGIECNVNDNNREIYISSILAAQIDNHQ